MSIILVAQKMSWGSETLGMIFDGLGEIFEGLGEMFEGDFADTCGKQILLCRCGDEHTQTGSEDPHPEWIFLLLLLNINNSC